MPNKSKFVTFILSVLPGVGHLYLGWQLRGLLFMLAFFMAIFLMDWVGLSLFTFLLPVIWFYSLFDALQCYDREPPAAQEPIAWDFEKQRMVGIALIIIGGLVLINKLAVPLLLKYLTYETLRLIGSSLVALLLVAGGIRLAWGVPLKRSMSNPTPKRTRIKPMEKEPTRHCLIGYSSSRSDCIAINRRRYPPGLGKTDFTATTARRKDADAGPVIGGQ